ncbi:MAG: competence protein ComEA [Legionella sp.]|nr:MAG: competence protein ComEA [Legionella sp.]
MKVTLSIVVLSLALLAGSSHAETLHSNPTQTIATKINLNHASAKELTHAIRGIGEKRAQAIVQYRQTHGQFKAITDLAAVHGIGQRFVQKNLLQLQEKFVC